MNKNYCDLLDDVILAQKAGEKVRNELQMAANEEAKNELRIAMSTFTPMFTQIKDKYGTFGVEGRSLFVEMDFGWCLTASGPSKIKNLVYKVTSRKRVCDVIMIVATPIPGYDPKLDLTINLHSGESYGLDFSGRWESTKTITDPAAEIPRLLQIIAGMVRGV